MGRSRGGLSSKLHAAVDANGMPLAIVLTGGQRNDGAVFTEVIDDIRVPRLGSGRPRTRPDAVIADKAYSNSIIRNYLSARGIKAVIPQKSNEKNSRKHKALPAVGRQPSMPGSIRPKRRRAPVRTGQAMAWHRHPLREARDHLPGHRSTLRSADLATQIGDMP